MKLSLLAILFCLTLYSCSTEPTREYTYEENLASCTKKLTRLPNNIDTTALKVAESEEKNELRIRECMKGSNGPDFMLKTDQDDSISTKPKQGRAMVLFFWFAALDAPAAFAKSDSASFAAMNELYHKYKRKADFIGLPFNEPLIKEKYLREHPLDFPQADTHEGVNDDIYKAVGPSSYPYILFINTNGKVVKVNGGTLTTKSKIIAAYSPIIQACIDNKPYND